MAKQVEDLQQRMAADAAGKPTLSQSLLKIIKTNPVPQPAPAPSVVVTVPTSNGAVTPAANTTVPPAKVVPPSTDTDSRPKKAPARAEAPTVNVVPPKGPTTPTPTPFKEPIGRVRPPMPQPSPENEAKSYELTPVRRGYVREHTTTLSCGAH